MPGWRQTFINSATRGSNLNVDAEQLHSHGHITSWRNTHPQWQKKFPYSLLSPFLPQVNQYLSGIWSFLCAQEPSVAQMVCITWVQFLPEATAALPGTGVTGASETQESLSQTSSMHWTDHKRPMRLRRRGSRSSPPQIPPHARPLLLSEVVSLSSK